MWIGILLKAAQGEVVVRDRRTRLDWAACVKALADIHYPAAGKIVLVMDNLNIHTPTSLYAAFPPAVARRLAGRLEIRHTPQHGSWLNMAEIEWGILQRQCLDRRPGDRATLTREVAIWAAARNASTTTIDRPFTTAHARITLKRLYQAHEE